MKPKSRAKQESRKDPASWKYALNEFLIDTAFRKPELENIMLHIADLADLPAVREEIMRLRKYAARRNGRKVA